MIVMGIDASTTSTGWCVLDNEENKLIARGCIKPNKTKSTIWRINYTWEEISKKYCQYEPEVVNIEEMVTFRNANTARALIGLEYYLLTRLSNMKCILNTVRPSEWRKSKIKGKNRAEQKANSIKYVYDKYGIEVNDDEADAICIAEYEVAI